MESGAHMVARRTDTQTATRVWWGFFSQLFEMWRSLVTQARDALLRLPSRLFPAEKTSPPELPLPWLLRPGIVWLGDAALALGIGVGIALAAPGQSRYLAAWAGAQAVLWAIVRWFLMRAARRGTAPDGSILLGASSLGLLAYAAAVTPELRVLAWVVSAGLTWLGLVRLGDRTREAGRTVAIAWGAQALVVAASWIARNGVLAWLASRG